MSDPYFVLGVDRTASDDEIKQAYRRLAKKHHPDRPGGNEEQFKRVNEAYDKIKNGEPQEQMSYEQNPFGGRSPFDFEDLFSQHFGQHVIRNQDIQVQMHVSLEDVFNCVTKDIMVALPTGKQRAVSIKIPKGITTNEVVRYMGYGDNTKPGPHGNLYVKFVINPHPEYTIDEYDLVKRLNITVKEAMLGAEKVIHTLDGRNLKLNVKPGTQPRSRLRIPESGLPRRNLPNGNLYIEIHVTIPALSDTDLNKPLKDLL